MSGPFDPLDSRDEVLDPEFDNEHHCLIYKFPDGELAILDCSLSSGREERWELRNTERNESRRFMTYDRLIAYRCGQRNREQNP